ncbi:MAG: hypothetical protein HC796_09405, partial [Synechococcaceae cyanobacterium RL_1_2]|nr:hypothetical protein [Synechococcaceae cyanobacterium RL_1_2]
MAYQSKLFQLLQTQWWKGKESLAKVWRNVQVQGQWAIQILAYPFYVAVQTTRVIGRQWEKTSYRLFSSNEELTNPPSPQKILAQVQLDAQTNFLACNLRERELMVSDRDGHLQPLGQLLKPAEEKKIRYEVASWQKRFKQNLLFQEPAAIVPVKTIDDHMITPIKWFWQTITWMQVSPIATTIDLFGERKTATPLIPFPPTPLALNPSGNSIDHLDHPETNTKPHGLLSSIDQTFAQWEKAFPNPPSK